jgi:hypothetical protein
MDRYTGPLEAGMILTGPDNDGVLGYRRVKLILREDDGGWIYEEAPSRLTKKLGFRAPRELGRCPELNLRIVFRPEEPTIIIDRDPGDENDWRAA